MDKWPALSRVSLIMGHHHIALEVLEMIGDNRDLFSENVLREFDSLVEDGRRLFFGDDICS